MSENRKQNKRWIRTFKNLSCKISFEAFIDVLEKTDDLLDIIGFNAMKKPIINIVDEKTYILCSDFMVNTSNTLKSIYACCNLGNFCDANMLVRKYRDNLFQYLYIIKASSNIKDIIKGDEFHKYFDGEITEEKLIKSVNYLLKILISGNKKTTRDRGIDAWFENKLTDCKKDKKSYKKNFDINPYIKYLCSDKLVKQCFESYFREMWKKLNRVQNNFTHGNGRKYLISNNSLFLDKKSSEKLLNDILKDIYMVTSCFLSILILIEPNYIASSDYIDYMELGLTPPENSQYWIAPIVQEYIDKYVVKIHSGLKAYLKKNNPYGMEII